LREHSEDALVEAEAGKAGIVLRSHA
jgi:hypothetical protein